MAIDSFNGLMQDVEFKRNNLTNSTIKKIRKLYKNIANDYMKRLGKVNKDSLEARYLEDSVKYLQEEYERLGKEFIKDLNKNIEIIIEETTSTQLSFFEKICDKYSVDLKPHFTQMFTKIHEDVLREVITGEMYKDKIKLSNRIWNDINKTKSDLEYILSEGLAKKKSVYNLAKDLEKYVNPKSAKGYDWSNIYPGTKKKIDFNAYRLASTYINHAYQYAAKKSCIKNPYVTKMKWMSSHDNRVCPLCAERDGKEYTPSELPMDHPLGRCTFIYVIPKSLDEIGEELGRWSRDEEENEKLDNWFNEYGLDFI